nr:MAG TPA: hypothetical protein [Microviridae sp.]
MTVNFLRYIVLHRIRAGDRGLRLIIITYPNLRLNVNK